MPTVDLPEVLTENLNRFNLVDSPQIALDNRFDIPLEGLSLSDAETLILGLTVAINDSVALNDNFDNYIVGIVEELSDSLSLSDSIALDGPGISLAFNDSISLSEALTVVAGISLVPSESLTLSDDMSSASPYSVGLSDTIDLSDAITVAGSDIDILMISVLSLSDSANVIVGLFPDGFSDSVSLSDVESGKASGFISESDSITLLDLLKINSPITGPEVSDSLLFTENLKSDLGLHFDHDDGLALSDFLQTMIFFTSLQFTDSFTLADSVAVQLMAQRTVSVSDSLNLSDSIDVRDLTSLIAYIRRYLNDVI